MCSEWGVVPHPLSTGARGWQGLPRLSTQLSPVRVRFQLQVWLLWGQFPPLIFGRTSRAGPGRQRDSCSRCRAGFQGHVLAGAAAVPGRAAIRAQMIRSSSRAPGEFQKAGERLLHLDSKGTMSLFIFKYLPFLKSKPLFGTRGLYGSVVQHLA